MLVVHHSLPGRTNTTSIDFLAGLYVTTAMSEYSTVIGWGTLLIIIVVLFVGLPDNNVNEGLQCCKGVDAKTQQAWSCLDPNSGQCYAVCDDEGHLQNATCGGKAPFHGDETPCVGSGYPGGTMGCRKYCGWCIDKDYNGKCIPKGLCNSEKCPNSDGECPVEEGLRVQGQDDDQCVSGCQSQSAGSKVCYAYANGGTPCGSNDPLGGNESTCSSCGQFCEWCIGADGTGRCVPRGSCRYPFPSQHGYPWYSPWSWYYYMKPPVQNWNWSNWKPHYSFRSIAY